MKSALNAKKAAAASALLIALSLTATGCSSGVVSDGSHSAGKQYVAPEVPAKKISEVPIAEDGDFEGWNSMAGEVNFKWSEADKASMKKNSAEIFAILTQDHPEYTVEGFKPTAEIWAKEIAPKLDPLTLKSERTTLSKAWAKDVPVTDGRVEDTATEPFLMNLVLTNQLEVLRSDSSGYDVLRSWKSKSGEKCSPSDKPFKVDAEALKLTTRPEGNNFASAYPLVTAQLQISIPCKEGGTLKYGFNPTIQLKKENGEWRLSGGQWFTGSGAGPADKIEK